MNTDSGLIANWVKQVMVIGGLLLFLPGILLAFGFVCVTLIMMVESDPNAIKIGLIGVTAIALTLGTGGTIFWHSVASLNGKRSNPIHFPPLFLMVSIFLLYIGLGLVLFQNTVLAGLLLPITVLVATTTLPVLVTWWMMGQSVSGITWRRGVVAFAGSAVVCVALGAVLQMLVMVTVSFLAPNPGDAILAGLDLVEDLIKNDLAYIIIDRGFLIALLVLSVVVPVIATLTKPLVTLPLTSCLSPRKLFFIGALAGAGFAAVESMMFIMLWPQYWAWILILQALGAAIHPVGAGMMALKWQNVFSKTTNSWMNWIAGAGLFTSVHALWNTGLLFVLPTVTNRFFMWINEVSFILLLVIGLVMFWTGHSITQQLYTNDRKGEMKKGENAFSNQAMAVWAVAMMVLIVPIGLVLLQMAIE